MATELQRTCDDEQYARELIGSITLVPPINGLFSALVTMFALFDHCTVFLADVAGMQDPMSAEFFGPRFFPFVNHLRQQSPAYDEHVRRLGYSDLEASHREPWADVLCKLRNRFIHRQCLMFQEDVDGMRRVVGRVEPVDASRIVSEFKFLVLVSRKLTELSILCKLSS